MKGIENKFFIAVEMACDNFEAFFNDVIANPDEIKMDLLINFSEFIIMCSELKKSNTESSSGIVNNKQEKNDKKKAKINFILTFSKMWIKSKKNNSNKWNQTEKWNRQHFICKFLFFSKWNIR